ncbi:FHA domain-containing protein [Geomonas sp. RF6]|uniref:FHA domain-containing protein n=1 Tax=Geomonas sp. RF6 TaxID=2897342 RepID=UPI001E4AB2CA|nr:FHA domain-containing protein [Geomonas sp. RF6]UFS70728.1 FHA domain-containing protein [Geomonas sp. RF6]
MMTPPHIAVQLIHIQGGLKGEIQEFHDPLITVGRLSTCSVHFPGDEPGVSRQHARIEREGNQFRLTDLSTYGTFVNGKPVREAILKNGDVLEFGPGGPKASFTMEIGAEPPVRLPRQAEPPAPAPPPPLPPVEPVRQQAGTPAPTHAPQEAQGEGAAYIPVQRTKAPVVIQLGPTIRTYCELPIMVGAGNAADFILRQPGICDQHAQVFHHEGSYWIKDLTGQGVVRVNQGRADGGVPLRTGDELLLSPQGPVLRFVGDGRFAEVDDFIKAPPAAPVVEEQVTDAALKREERGRFSRLFKGWKG